MSQLPTTPPRRPLLSLPHLPPDGAATSRPPPVWRQLAPESRRQLAQVVADLLRRSHLRQHLREGPDDDAHPER